MIRQRIAQDPPYNENIALQYYRNKSRPIAWFASFCSTFSKREKYAEALNKHIKIDIYGACGPLYCDRMKNDCWKLLSIKYWFYLAFENSICKDYVTEKFYESAAQYVVPIVLKRSLLENLAPSHSFIAVDDFNGTQQLADYLKYLMKNSDAYLRYFDWKKTHSVHIGPWRSLVGTNIDTDFLMLARDFEA